jgi:hypothetical protein
VGASSVRATTRIIPANFDYQLLLTTPAESVEAVSLAVARRRGTPSPTPLLS